MIEYEDRSHYIYSKSIEHFTNISHNACDSEGRHCPMCDGKIAHKEYNNHISKCFKFAKNGTLLSLPSKGEVMEFKNYKNMIERPYIVYADCECSLIPTDEKYNIAKHVPNSACFFLVCSYDASQNTMWIATGEDCVAKMVVELDSLAKKCIAKMKEIEPMNLTRSDLSKFYNAKECHICSRP